MLGLTPTLVMQKMTKLVLRDEAAVLCPQNGEMGTAVLLRPCCATCHHPARGAFSSLGSHTSQVPGCGRGTVLSSDMPSSPPRTCPKETKLAEMERHSAGREREDYVHSKALKGDILIDRRMESLGRSADWPPKLGTNPHHLPTSSMAQHCRGNC